MGWGRAYFAVQAFAGAAWWVAVFAVPLVRDRTLGSLDPVAVAWLDVPLFVLASGGAAFGVRLAAFVATAWTSLVAVALAAFATMTGEAGWGVLLMVAATAGSVAALCLMVIGSIPTAWIAGGPFAFRTAKPGSVARHMTVTCLQVAAFWGVFLLALPLVIVTAEQRWQLSFELPDAVVPLGVVLVIAASALGLASAFVMSSRGAGTPLPSAMPARLVIAGPYRWVRNPMAVAGILQGVAVGMLLQSWLVVAYALVGSLLWNYAVRPHEEADLESRFGPEFHRYRAEVRCWVPKIPRQTSGF